MADEPKLNGLAATASSNGWMSDVQRALALMLIGSFAFVTVFSTICSVFWPTSVVLTDMAKSLQSNLTNMCLIGLGFFFGNTMAKMTQDAGQQKVVEKLTGQPPAAGPVAPVPQPIVTVAWWSLLTDAEKAAMTEAAKTDAKMQALIATFSAGKAEPADIAALVAAGILQQDRAAVFKTA